MCRSKKSINGHFDWCSTSRISLMAVVENANGVTGPSIAASRTPTTLSASSTVVMNGINRRSKRRSGNWMSSAFPIVSALIPVLSDKKKTGMAGRSGATTLGSLSMASFLFGEYRENRPLRLLDLRQDGCDDERPQ